MSETPDETQTETETPEETTPDTTPDAEPTPEEEEAEIQENEEQALARVTAASSADIPRKIERAVTDQRKRLSKIVGVDLTGQECPTCDGMGYTIGGSDPGLSFREDPTKEACPTCDGLGQLISHSKAPGHELVTCIECAGQGWRMKPAENVHQFTPTPPQTAQAGPVMGFQNPDGTFTPFGVNTPQTVPQTG